MKIVSSGVTLIVYLIFMCNIILIRFALDLSHEVKELKTEVSNLRTEVLEAKKEVKTAFTFNK